MDPAVLRTSASVDSAKRDLAAAYHDLAHLADSTEDPLLRGRINALLWECAAGQASRDRFFSQYGQDAYLDNHIFGGKRDGVFVEVGGFDGVTGSNCLFFEIFRGWSGLMIEAVPEHFDAASAFRRCACVQALVGDGGPAEFLTIDAGPVQMSGLVASYDATRRAWVDEQASTSLRVDTRETQRLGDILLAQDITRIDLLCVDIEGAETPVLESFPFDAISVDCWCIETAGCREPVLDIMRAQGYEWIDRIGHDDLFAVPALA